MDGLTGFPDAVRAVFSTDQDSAAHSAYGAQQHKVCGYKDLEAICRDLKKVYSAPTEEEALLALDDFGRAWNSRYPMIRRS